jgi:hypothetical protein
MIPPFNQSGVLPPLVGQAHDPGMRSPYPASMVEIVNRFATSAPRRAILRGLVAYRAELRAIGIDRGFQWLDGSYVEDVEATRLRSPADIDLVTFARRPAGTELNDAWATLLERRCDLFSPREAKLKFRCDAYFVDLGTVEVEWLVMRATYWASLFSHRRDTHLWKGMLQVDLADDSDLTTLFSELLDD